MTIEKPDQAWATEITCTPMAQGFMCQNDPSAHASRAGEQKPGSLGGIGHSPVFKFNYLLIPCKKGSRLAPLHGYCESEKRKLEFTHRAESLILASAAPFGSVATTVAEAMAAFISAVFPAVTPVGTEQVICANSPAPNPWALITIACNT